MDTWKRFNETFLLDKEDFYSNLKMEDITNSDHKHAKKSIAMLVIIMIWMFKATHYCV